MTKNSEIGGAQGMVNIREGALDEAFRVHLSVPELYPLQSVAEYNNRIGSKECVILIAEVREAPVGFKLGYALDKSTFYSWIGGVIPEYRSQGIAVALLKAQEKSVADMGYRVIKVKTMNRFPAMLKMLVSHGYLIDGYEARNGPHDAKITLSKDIV